MKYTSDIWKHEDGYRGLVYGRNGAIVDTLVYKNDWDSAVRFLSYLYPSIDVTLRQRADKVKALNFEWSSVTQGA